MASISYELADESHFEQIAALRWALCTEDDSIDQSISSKLFINQCISALKAREPFGSTFHWIAIKSAKVIGVMTVISVAQLPSPKRANGHWAYLTNCYVALENRYGGVGTQLLSAVKSWCRMREFEVVIVWPSERAFPFYERSGFRAERDPLSLAFNIERKTEQV